MEFSARILDEFLEVDKVPPRRKKGRNMEEKLKFFEASWGYCY